MYICKKMLVRIETIKDSERVLLVDELGKFLGEMEDIEFFVECILTHREPIEEDGYVFYYVSQGCVELKLNGNDRR